MRLSDSEIEYLKIIGDFDPALPHATILTPPLGGEIKKLTK